MPGLGSESKLGIAKETTPGTGVVPSSCLPFVSEAFTSAQPLLEGESIGGSAMLKTAVPGDEEGTGGINQEFDAESSGFLLDLWNGPNGYTAPGAPWTAGQITDAPTGSAGSTAGTIPTGTYIYRVGAIWKHDWLEKEFQMPQSAASSGIAVVLGEKVTLAFTNPAGLTLADHTYHGTAIFRTAAGGGAGTTKYLGRVLGTTATFEDDGSNDFADANRVPVPNTNMYLHEMEGAQAAEGEDRCEHFTAQISKNVGADEQFRGNKVNTFTLALPGRAATVTLQTQTLGANRIRIDGEFAASAPVPRQQIIGRNCALVVNGTKNCDIQAMTLNGTNNQSRQATFCAVTISDGARRVSGQWTLIFRDQDLLNKAIAGEELDVQLYMYGEPLVATGSHLSAVSHGIDAIPYPRLAKFDFPRLIMSGFVNQVAGPDQITATASFLAAEHLVDGYDMKVTLINTIDDYT